MSLLLNTPISPAETPPVCSPDRITIVVPCFNEAESLAGLAAALDELRTTLRGHYAAEFLLIDDGSRDDTWRLMRDLFNDLGDVRLLRHEKNRGIAATIATGLAHATTEIVASIDADCTYDPRQLASLLPLLAGEVDLVVASPYHPAGQVVGVPQWRLAISKIASRLYRLVMHNKLHTYTSCFRVYRKSAVADLPLASGGFVGIVELVWQLDRRGGRIVECPAVLTVRKTGHSKMRVVRTTLAHLRLLTRAAWSRLCQPARTHSATTDSAYPSAQPQGLAGSSAAPQSSAP